MAKWNMSNLLQNSYQYLPTVSYKIFVIIRENPHMLKKRCIFSAKRMVLNWVFFTYLPTITPAVILGGINTHRGLRDANKVYAGTVV